MVQGWASASLELSLFRQLFLCCLEPGKRGGRVYYPRPAGGPCSGGPSASIHTVSLPQVRGKGPVAEGWGASREYFCPRSDHSLGLPNVARGGGANTHTQHSFTVTHGTKLNIVLHIHSPVLPYTHTGTQSQTHANSCLHSVTNTSSHSPDGQSWMGAAGVLQGQGRSGRGRLFGAQGSLRSGAPDELDPLPLGLP